jgi:TolB-like protein
MKPDRILCLATLLAVAACAPRAQPSEPGPVDLSALDARRAAHPADARTLADVGVAFYRAGAPDRARDALTAALAIDPRDFRAAVHLGLADEALGDYEAALAAYRSAGALKVSRAERRTVEERLVGLTHQRLALMARRAIAQERTLATTPPSPNSIAVLPWTYVGTNPDLKPLERGLAHLFLSDLAKLPRFTLLERERTQALIDELALAASARVAPATAARSGLLLGAEQVLSGAFRDTDNGTIRLDANVVRATTAEVRATGTASDRLEQLFAMEKSVLFDLLDRMAVSLTPAERRALAERPTADIQSFLAFSRGLDAEDRGDFGSATAFFDQAAARDPSFVAARQRAARSTRLGVASRVTAASLSAVAERPGKSVRGAQLAAALQNIAPSMAGRLNRVNRPTVIRSRLAEALRQDDALRIGVTSQGTTGIPRP